MGEPAPTNAAVVSTSPSRRVPNHLPSKSPIGRVPTQVDYADYHDVNGIKMPFHMTFAWLNGRDAIHLNEVQVNVPIDPVVFGRPARPVTVGGGN